MNDTTVEKVENWFWNANNGTIGCGAYPQDMNQVWYLKFYNEDSYEKQVHLEVTKVSHGLFCGARTTFSISIIFLDLLPEIQEHEC